MSGVARAAWPGPAPGWPSEVCIGYSRWVAQLLPPRIGERRLERGVQGACSFW